MTTPTLPDWPPPDNEKIGIERARAYIAWIKQHAPPVLDDARAMLLARYPYAEIRTSAMSVGRLADQSLSPTMPGLWIGMVWAPIAGGTHAMVDISITRDGRLVAKPGWNMR